MTLTDAQLDVYCGETPKYRLRCAFCKRVVGPYHTVGNARIALQTHLAYVHFSDQIKPSSRDDELKPTSRGKTVKTRARSFKRP